MRDYWDARARDNAAWYVDTTLAYDAPDMERFFESGEAIVAGALDEAPVQPDRRETALEIGSGLGRMTLALRRRFDRVIGVDVSPEMLARAGELVRDPGVSFLLGDGRSLAGVESGSVDFIVSFTVFQHIPDVDVVDGYLREAARVLRPGGVLAVQWNNEPGPRRWALRRRLLGLLQRTGLRPEPRLRHAPEFLGCRIPLARIDSVLTSCGMHREGLRDAGTLYAWVWARKR